MTWALGPWDMTSSLDDFGGSDFGVVGSFFGPKMTPSRVFLEILRALLALLGPSVYEAQDARSQRSVVLRHRQGGVGRLRATRRLGL